MKITKLLPALLIFIVLQTAVLAQQYSITGTVVDNTNQSLPFATVKAFRAEDSTSTYTNIDGFFNIKLARGTYNFDVVYVSYKTKTLRNITIDSDFSLDTIVLSPETVELDAAVIEVEKNPMTLQLDKRVFNVAENPTNAGNTATEVLENIPSVEVDVEGNVSLRGSGNVRILIDGKPSGIMSSDLSGLSMIQADMIERVEVITNPSSRYDAEGEVGIINIVLKKEQQKGLNGNFELMTGYPHNHKASINLNYRTKKVNIFSGYNVYYRMSPGRGNSYQSFDLPDTNFYYRQDNERERGGLGNNFRFGSDIFLNEKNTLTLTANFVNSKGDNSAQNIYRDYNSNEVLVSRSVRDDDEVERKKIIEGGLNYVKTFDKKDQKLSIDLKAYESDDRENSVITQTFSTAPDSTLNQYSSNAEDESTFLFQADYIHPVKSNGKFETGLKSTHRIIENNFTVEQESNGELIPLSEFNNEFEYTENIYAAYAQFGNKLDAFSYQFGLRSEYSDISTTLLKTNQVNDRDYIGLFPSAFFAREIDSNSTLQLSYSRRISRPRFRHLLPFYGYNDNRNIYTGNPNLNPFYTNSFELGYLRYFKRGSFLPTIFYRQSKGVIDRITITNNLGVTQRLPVNLANENSIGVEFTANYNIAKWWHTNGSLNFYHSSISGRYQEYELDRQTFRLGLQGTSKIDLDKKTVFQTNLRYRSPQQTTQGYRKAMFTIDMALSREVFGDKGQLVLSVRDLLNSRKYRSVIETEDYYLESESQRRMRQITLTFTYNLRQSKKKRSREGDNSSGVDDDSDF